MTAPTLPATLERLSVLVPARFGRSEVINAGPVYARIGNLTVWPGSENYPLAVEAALRAECASRNWHWSCGTSRWTPEQQPPYYARIEAGPIIQADSPAHALALALVAALEAIP